MPDCIIVADDLTGANATGALFAKAGHEAAVVFDGAEIALAARVMIHNTDSRNQQSAVGRNKVRAVLQKYDEQRSALFCKRIDSTLRGSPGAEVEEMLAFLGGEYLAAVLPAFPQAGRVLRDSCMLVNGEPLAVSSSGTDPLSPVNTSNVLDILRRQCTLPVEAVTVADLAGGADAVAARLRELHGRRVRIVLFDAIDDDNIALAARALEDSGLPYLPADPGVFSAACFEERCRRHRNDRVLLVIGSTCREGREQLDILRDNETVHLEYVSVGELLVPERRLAELERVIRRTVDAAKSGRVCAVVSCGILPEHKVDLAAYCGLGETVHDKAEQIAADFGVLAARLLEAVPQFGALFASGGDIATHAGKALGAGGLRVKEEVLPLVAYGTLVGGSRNGLSVVTKGGMAGDPGAILTCVRFLARRIGDSLEN